MGIFNLFGFCIALLFAPALVFANEVRVGVSPTTGYYEVTSKTFDVPKAATVSSSRAVSPVVSPLPSGGFQQSMSGGITIEGLKKPAPFTAKAAASLKTMRNGAKKLYKSNPARLASGLGFGALIDGLGWIMGEGGQIQKKQFIDSGQGSSKGWFKVHFGDDGYVSDTCPSFIPYNGSPFTCTINFYWASGDENTQSTTVTYTGSYSPPSTSYYRRNGAHTAFNYHSTETAEESIVSVSSSEVENVIDKNYIPHADDFVLLTPYMSPDFILVDPIPPVVTDLGITNTFDSSGWLTGTEQKTSTTEFTISNNSTSQPSISSSTSVKTETFKDGQSQGSTVTETTQPAVGGGGGGKAPTVEIPTDCDFHPTLCAWMNWTKEPLEEPDHDLKQIMHTVDFEEKKTISFGSKTCPAPYDIHLGLIDRTYQLSFQPACDFAGYLYFFVMAAAYIFAAYISVGVVRNG